MLWCAGTGCVLVRSAQATEVGAGDSALADAMNAGEMGASQHAACHAKQGQSRLKHRVRVRNSRKPSSNDILRDRVNQMR